MERLSGRRAIVTAGANGIGRAIVERFVAEGAQVAFCDVDIPGGRALAERLPQARFIRADCSRSEEVRGFMAEAIAGLGGVDVLVNNAGVTESGGVLDLEEDAFDRVMAVNLKAALLATQAGARRMVADGVRGAVINMSSVNAVLTIPELLAYNVSKGALGQLTRNAAVALAPHGIRVNAIGPGTILTDLVRNSIYTSDEARRRVMSRTPLGRAGEPEEIAAIAVFLASEEASYVTGQTLYADGGRLALNYTVPVEG